MQVWPHPPLLGPPLSQLPITLRIKCKQLTKAPSSGLTLPPFLLLAHSVPATQASSLHHQHTKHSPAPGPLHRLWSLPGPLAWIPRLDPCHSDFTQKPPPWGAITVYPPAISTCYRSSPVDLERQGGWNRVSHFQHMAGRQILVDFTIE